MIHPHRLPSLVIADQFGTITDLPDLNMAGMSGGGFLLPDLDDLIPLPEGSELFALPGRLPVGFDPESGEPLLVEEYPFDGGGTVQAVAAFMAPAHTILANCAFTTSAGAPILPLFAYTAVGWLDDQFWVCGFRSDPDRRQDRNHYHPPTVQRATKATLKKHGQNRLIQHLGKCCLTYGCPAARNLFLNRYEAPLPTSPQCNARCVGCISLQESGCCPSTQDRISFVPTAKEICEIAIPHLSKAVGAIVSFGQGCEGEPLLQADVIEQAIGQMRRHTARGTINLNSNASLPQAVGRLARAGLDSLRVSLNSVQEDFYTSYYRPKGYSFADVKASIKTMKDHGKFVSLNYFIQPGITDSMKEFSELCRFIETLGPDLIQLRNLNMDPELYLRTLGATNDGEKLGLRRWLAELKTAFPQLRLGYFNPSLDPSCPL